MHENHEIRMFGLTCALWLCVGAAVLVALLHAGLHTFGALDVSLLSATSAAALLGRLR